jgi:putative DNA primase/helicase
MSASLDGLPTFLTDLARWPMYREVEQTNANGTVRKTKKPFTTAARPGSSTDPSTWTDFATASGVLRLGTKAFDGVGIALGDLDNGEHLCGIDFDSCLDENGAVAPWAEPTVTAISAVTYVEVSPSGTGLKAYFRIIDAWDADGARGDFGIATGQWGCKRSVPGAQNGQAHGPAIEVYLGPGRYFAATGERWPSSIEDVARLDRATLHRIAALVSDATGAANQGGSSGPRASGGKKRGKDKTRSVAAFRLGLKLRRQGATFDEMCEAIRTHPDTAEWCRDKGDANGGRELLNIWENADKFVGPYVLVRGGNRHEAADAGLAALFSSGAEFFVRDKVLVRIGQIKAKSADGSTVLVPSVIPVNAAILGRALGQAIRWEKSGRDDEIMTIDPPREIVEQIAAMTDAWPFPPLRGLIDTPTLRPDGSILQTPGYDTATGYYLSNPPPMPAIPDKPSKADALDALALLNNDLLCDFPFIDNAARSVAISMLMTPVLRAAMVVVPLHAVSAPEAGTGKSYLADIASTIAVGDRCAVMAVSDKAEETEKRLIGAALAQFPIIALDNVSTLLWGDFLCQATERAQLQVRPLGTSGLVRIANAFTVFANGNNLTIAADNVRRTVLCSLDADMEAPETRTFNGDPVAKVLRDRGNYVGAILTIARAYIAAGCPGRLAPHASYEGWSNLVRSPLVWLGWSDPVETVAAIRAEDPIRQNRTAVFAAWGKELVIGDGYRVAELIDHTEERDQFFARTKPELFTAFHAVAALRGGGEKIDPIRLAHWLRRNLGTIAHGAKLTVDRSDGFRPRWTLETQ